MQKLAIFHGVNHRVTAVRVPSIEDHRVTAVRVPSIKEFIWTRVSPSKSGSTLIWRALKWSYKNCALIVTLNVCSQWNKITYKAME